MLARRAETRRPPGLNDPQDLLAAPLARLALAPVDRPFVLEVAELARGLHQQEEPGWEAEEPSDEVVRAFLEAWHGTKYEGRVTYKLREHAAELAFYRLQDLARFLCSLLRFDTSAADKRRVIDHFNFQFRLPDNVLQIQRVVFPDQNPARIVVTRLIAPGLSERARNWTAANVDPWRVVLFPTPPTTETPWLVGVINLTY